MSGLDLVYTGSIIWSTGASHWGVNRQHRQQFLRIIRHLHFPVRWCCCCHTSTYRHCQHISMIYITTGKTSKTNFYLDNFLVLLHKCFKAVHHMATLRQIKILQMIIVFLFSRWRVICWARTRIWARGWGRTRIWARSGGRIWTWIRTRSRVWGWTRTSSRRRNILDTKRCWLPCHGLYRHRGRYGTWQHVTCIRKCF